MKDEYKAVGSWGTLGLEIVISILFGFWLGYKADAWLHTDPWLKLVGFFLGCGAAVKALMRTHKEMQAVTAREEKLQGNPRPAWEKPDDREKDEGSREGGAGTRSDAPEDHERTS
jgi:hypothetical protein